MAEAAKIKEEQIYLFDLQREEATKRDVAPAGHFGAVGGGTHGHPVQLDVSTCQIITQAIQQQFSPEQASALIAALQELNISGPVPAGRHAGGTTAKASVLVPVAPVATSQAAPAATSMAAEAERLQLEAAIAGGKGGGKGRGDNFRPYEASSEATSPVGSETSPGGKGDGDL